MTKKRSVILGATGIVYNWRMQIWYIYGLADPETPVVRYVGKTNDPCARLRNHLSDARKGGRNHRARGLKKALTDNGRRRLQESAQRSRTIAGEERMAAVARETISAFNNSQSHEQRSARATEVNLETWAKRTSEDRERISKNISAGHLKLTPEKRQEISAKGNAAIAASPEIRQAIGNRISGWWTSLTPEAKAEYLERRTAAIKEGKARKKREREAAGK